MTRLIKIGRLAGCIGYHVGCPAGWEVAVDVIVGWRPHIACVSAGWGYDGFAPLRPWPKVWWRRTSPKGHRLTGGAWFGFFFNVGGR